MVTWNQSIVQQLIRDGNILSLFLNASPIGLIARTTCRFCRTRSMKKLYIARGVASIFLPYKQLKTKRYKQSFELTIIRLCQPYIYIIPCTASKTIIKNREIWKYKSSRMLHFCIQISVVDTSSIRYIMPKNWWSFIRP